jgi:hypothetical protein
MKWFGITGNLLRTRAWVGFGLGKAVIKRSGEGFSKGSGLGVCGLVGLRLIGFFARAGQ